MKIHFKTYSITALTLLLLGGSFTFISTAYAQCAAGDFDPSCVSYDQSNQPTTAPVNTVQQNPTQNNAAIQAPNQSNTIQQNTIPNNVVIQAPVTQSQAPTSGGFFYIQNPLSSNFNTVGGVVEGFLEIISYLAVILAVLAIIWIGLQFVLARGDSDKLKDLKNELLAVVIGVAIVIGARVILTVVINTLQATGTVNQNVITNAQNAIHGN